MYHQAVQKNGGRWEEYATGFDMHNEIFRLEKDDALVISVPFSDTGKQRDDLGYALSHAKRMNIPVLLDFCYYPVTKNINIDLDLYPNIDTITFSMSKIFKGAESLRVGVRMEREDRDDGIDVFNSVGMYNNIALKILNEYMEEYDVDYCWRKYKNKYEQACQELNLKPTDCVLFGLGGDEYSDFNRGNEHNRVCVSQRLGQS